MQPTATLIGGVLVSLTLWVTEPASAQIPDGYYDSVDSSTPQALRASLNEIIDDHTRFPYTSSSTDTWDILKLADEDPNDSGRIITIYRNASFAKQTGGNAFYNREHTWPRSYGFPDNNTSVNYPFTDMHHLFLADGNYNFDRSNKPYEDCDAGCTEHVTETNDGRGGLGGGYPGDSNWTSGDFTQGKWEVWRDRKGDIARAMMYMDVRYEGGQHGVTGANEPDLILTDDRNLIASANTGQNQFTGYMGILSTLLNWHTQDPVDAAEIRHHEAVAMFQGNRNPFIDHPEWADCIFASLCNFFSINAGLNDAWVSANAALQGFFFTVYEDLGLFFLSWFSFDSVPPDGSVAAVFGAMDQKWVTGAAAYSGNSVTLNVELTSGGIFDGSEPLATQQPGYGTITIVFSDCNQALLTYNFPSLGLSGQMTLTRAVPDNVALCQALSSE